MMNTFMLLYFVVLWIKKTFYSLPKLYYYNSATKKLFCFQRRPTFYLVRKILFASVIYKLKARGSESYIFFE